MNCPYCNAEIGGTVQVGSVAYARVSRGQCPSCGRGMPAGYIVDFVSSSGQLASVERAYQETLRRGAELRDTMAVGGAHGNYKSVMIHAFFGSIGLFFILYSLLTMTAGVIVFEIGSFVFSLVISIIYWLVPVWISRLYYMKFIHKYDVKVALTIVDIKCIVAAISWLLFFTALLVFLGVIINYV